MRRLGTQGAGGSFPGRRGRQEANGSVSGWRKRRKTRWLPTSGSGGSALHTGGDDTEAVEEVFPPDAVLRGREWLEDDTEGELGTDVGCRSVESVFHIGGDDPEAEAEEGDL